MGSLERGAGPAPAPGRPARARAKAPPPLPPSPGAFSRTGAGLSAAAPDQAGGLLRGQTAPGAVFPELSSRPERKESCSVPQRDGRRRREGPLQRWGLGPAGSARGAWAGSSVAAGSEREARAASFGGPASCRQLRCGAMEELDGEPIVTVRAPRRVLLARAD